MTTAAKLCAEDLYGVCRGFGLDQSERTRKNALGLSVHFGETISSMHHDCELTMCATVANEPQSASFRTWSPSWRRCPQMYEKIRRLPLASWHFVCAAIEMAPISPHSWPVASPVAIFDEHLPPSRVQQLSPHCQVPELTAACGSTYELAVLSHWLRLDLIN
eukprot:SAG31_NODE_981_length_10558_cov_2.972273_7_plen_162_part_00